MVHSPLTVFRFSEYNFIVICLILNFVSTTIKLQENICQNEHVIVGFPKCAQGNRWLSEDVSCSKSTPEEGLIL
jgi:hypothetical protein